MRDVVSLGSINVDRIHTVTEAQVRALESRYSWFPDRGETVEVTDLPEDFGTAPDRVRQGGKGANQAVAASVAGASTAMLGKVGTDAETLGALDTLEDSGVDVTAVQTDTEPTGTAYVFVEESGDNRIVVRAGANAGIDREYVEAHESACTGADVLLLQNEIPSGPVEALLTRLDDASRRPTVVLDPSPVDGAAEFLRYDAVDYVTPNHAEYEALAPEIAAFDGVVVHKHGPDDVVVEGERSFTVTPPSVAPLDTTGAGDVLNGFFAARLAAGDSLERALEVATAAASLSTLTTGAQEGIPTLSEALAALDGHSVED